MKLRNVLLVLCLLVFLCIDAQGQMPLAPPGLIQVNPPFEGCELIWSSNTILSYDWFGEYRLDVIPGVVPGAPHNVLSATHADAVVAALVPGDILYVDLAGDLNRLPIGAVGDVLTLGAALPGWAAVLWEVDNNYRGGNPSLEPIAAQAGVPVMAFDVTGTWYNTFTHNGVDNIHDSNLGHHQFFTTGALNAVQAFAPGQVPGGASTHHTDIGHDDIQGRVETTFGDLQAIAPVGDDFYTMNDFGVGTNAPTERTEIVGDDVIVCLNDNTPAGALSRIMFTFGHAPTAFIPDWYAGLFGDQFYIYADDGVGLVFPFSIEDGAGADPYHVNTLRGINVNISGFDQDSWINGAAVFPVLGVDAGDDFAYADSLHVGAIVGDPGPDNLDVDGEIQTGTAAAAGLIRIADGAGNYIGVDTPAGIGADWTLTLPAAAPVNAGDVIIGTDLIGNTLWDYNYSHAYQYGLPVFDTSMGMTLLNTAGFANTLAPTRTGAITNVSIYIGIWNVVGLADNISFTVWTGPAGILAPTIGPINIGGPAPLVWCQPAGLALTGCADVIQVDITGIPDGANFDLLADITVVVDYACSI